MPETMPKTEGVLHFTIPVKNLDRAEKFYTGMLGFEKVGRTDKIVFLRAGGDFFNLTYSANPIALNPEGEHQIHSAFRVTPEIYELTIKTLPQKGVAIFKEENREFGRLCRPQRLHPRSRRQCHRIHRSQTRTCEDVRKCPTNRSAASSPATTS